MASRKLPLWKVILFSMIPAVLLFVAIESVARIVWSSLEEKALTTDPNKVINYSRDFDPVLGYRLKPNFHLSEGPFTSKIGRFEFAFPMYIYHNANGFMQTEEVAPVKKQGAFASSPSGNRPPRVTTRSRTIRPSCVISCAVMASTREAWRC